MGLAVLHGKMNVEDACTASRLEEESNVENWGLVEGGHDVDRANNKVMVSHLTPQATCALPRLEL